jgi:hypothetical protein
VKRGDNVSVPMIRGLKGVLDREKSPVGIFNTLAPITEPMVGDWKLTSDRLRVSLTIVN